VTCDQFNFYFAGVREWAQRVYGRVIIKSVFLNLCDHMHLCGWQKYKCRWQIWCR